METTNAVSPDTLHDDRPNDLRWSRANIEEAMPGVVTPLSWSVWGVVTERSSRAIYTRKLGTFGPSELGGSLEDTFITLFHGRVAVNVDLLRRLVGRIPGVDADAMELQLLGEVCGDPVERTWRRLPVIAARVPVAVALLPRRLRTIRTSVDTWWRAETSREPSTVTDAAALLRAGRDRFTATAVEHGFNVFIGQGLYDRLAKLAAAAGRPGLELRLSASGHGIEETRMIEDLWAAAEGRLPVDEVVARHGHHGPDEGEVSSHSWREDRAPLLALLERYRVAARPPGRSSVTADRAEAERSLLDGLPAHRRPAARAVLRLVDVYLPLREVGKAAFLQCLDVCRHAAHAAGRHLAAQGRLDDPDDIRFFTLEEIEGERVDRVIAAARRARREELLSLDVPDTFRGTPEPWPKAGAPTRADHIVSGVAGAPGRAKGVIRLVRDPGDCAQLEEGDILLCELTDPGWTPLFAVAAAVVVDIGGPLSHGAIVARELGIPCVIGTGDGSRRL
ncbi:MAG: hypothetical protein JWP02_3727, partial [Acidimicrobiales bacterium]|nr:hypothetical protein [Acidimicrobiales bacterium]